MSLSKMKSMISVFGIIFIGISQVFAQTGSLPGNASDLKAESFDQKVKLTWTAATDPDGTIKGYTIYYGNNSVGEDNNNNYDDSVEVDGNKTEFEVNNLINGVKYFFAMTATDNDGNESPYYSDEVMALPNKVQNSSLMVLSAKHTEPTKIEIKMSKTVKVDSKYDAFRVENVENGLKVPIIDTIVNSEVVTLVIGAGTMTTGDLYKVTATLGVSDSEGNPIASGITDTVKFTAKDDFPQQNDTTNDDTGGDSDNSSNNTNVTDVNGNGNSEDDFWDNFLDESIDKEDSTEVTQDNKNDDVNEETVDPFSVDPEPVLNTNNTDNSNDEEKVIPAIEDKEAPEEAQNIKVDKKSAATKGTVKISWTPSVSNDVLNQILYLRIGLKDWDKGTTLKKTDSEYVLKVKSHENYQVRLVTTDVAGNKSYGQEFTFSTSLVSTGLNILYVVFFGIILSVLFIGGFRKSV